jgi:hypothetical protein
MKRFIWIFGFFMMRHLAQAQPVTFATDVASIIYKNCTSCHRAGEIGPMPLTNYQQAVAYGSMIASVTQSKYMPPWKPNAGYTHFVGERILSATDIQKIQDWATQGFLRGDSTQEPPTPTFPSGSQLGTPNLVLGMSQKYQIQGNNTDEYRNFVIPSNLLQDVQIAAVEFRPGNRKIVHHALIGFDTTGTARRKDQQNVGYGYPGFGFNSDVQGEFMGYTPGSSVIRFPAGIGKRLPAQADIVIQVHYAPSPTSDSDQSTLNFFYTQGATNRQATTYAASPYDFIGGASSFVIPPNTQPKFTATRTVPAAISLMSIYPHAHLLGKSWKCYAITLQKDTIPLIKIDDWDFNWQGAYVFPRFIKIPVGAKIYVEGVYDNTTSNPRNPNNPPKSVTWGESTTDEMFLCYITYVPYQVGDELKALETQNLSSYQKNTSFSIEQFYPNPTNGIASLRFQMHQNDKITFSVFNLQGKQIKQLSPALFSAGEQLKNFDFSNLAPGLYFLRMEGSTHQSTIPFHVE